MGCACLRGDGHHWPARGARRVAAGRRQDGGLAHQPDAAGPDAGSELLRPGGHADAVSISDDDEQPDAVHEPNAIPHPNGSGEPVGDRDRRRFPDALPIAGRDNDALTIAERQRETFSFAIASS